MQGYKLAVQGYKVAGKAGFGEVSDPVLIAGGSTEIVDTGPIKFPRVDQRDLSRLVGMSYWSRVLKISWIMEPNSSWLMVPEVLRPHPPSVS